TVTAGLCQTATNTYSATALVQLTNPPAGVLTLSTGGKSLTFSTSALSPSSFTASFEGLVSDGASHTVVASLPGCDPAHVSYTAPVSCSPTLICSVSVTAIVVPGTCIGGTPQANGQIVLSQFQPGYTYQYSLGASFNPGALLSGAAQAIPAGGVLASTLANPAAAQAYTVRVYNPSGCSSDMTVVLQPTACPCPPVVCVPLFISRTKRGPRL
ncbi:hypothetical protein, partial [Spirosoma areae]